MEDRVGALEESLVDIRGSMTGVNNHLANLVTMIAQLTGAGTNANPENVDAGAGMGAGGAGVDPPPVQRRRFDSSCLMVGLGVGATVGAGIHQLPVVVVTLE